MIGSVGAELLVLRKRVATWILLGLWLTLATIFSYVVPYVTWRNTIGTPQERPLDELLPDALVAALAGGFPFDGGAIALMLGVLSLGSDYTWGTLKTLLTQGPGRLHIFAAKLIALGVTLVPFVVLVFAIGLVCSLAIAGLEGAEAIWPSATRVGLAMLAAWFILAVWAALGVLLAVLSHGTSLAIGVGILYTLAIEGLLAILARSINLLEPLVELLLRTNAFSIVGALGATIDTDGPGAFSGPFVGATQAVLVMAVYAVAFIGLSAVVVRRRDVTG
jgi:ABC-type transport system involved in multi-copper enzyme maturation permease subunit